MFHQIKLTLKKLIPEPVLHAYHFVLAVLASLIYGFPTSKLFVIGITGTKGKTSTANYIWSVLNSSGFKTGLLGTANIRIGDSERMNPYHMTMPGPFVLQKLFKKMVEQGCTHVVLEATSEGLKLWRQTGISFDAAVFTNLTPEHLLSHGGNFEHYKRVKAKLFMRTKNIFILNSDDEHFSYYHNFPAKNKITYGINSGQIRASEISENSSGVDFKVGQEKYCLSILGRFNVYNALPAIALGKTLRVPVENIAAGLRSLTVIPGRMEKIEQGQNFTILVDYAHEKVSINLALDAAKKIAKENKVIILLGAEGGGRDKSKRPVMGEAAAKKADYVIVADVDPYNDSPQEIIDDIAAAAEAEGKTKGQNLFLISDRRKAIAKALSLAEKDDVVLITGKGAEQSMVIGEKIIPWDDREVVREELKKIA
ncbi:MAG: UDP-N-acetylmuramoyl-L-alanyl-D-glutamate--2,6-diaminopimelate ligase [bacterium]|nr:UDP-N-acetylmuramoyl-L-alanyl-D-glutamate--2,6-diaminopimelate ligase [bacterium]